ncbi:MAG: L-serine ammonia-lyase, iron-sulfur-dependent, subunit alpha [Thermanaerothrix sp.]|nr:L-serine ammonia-lyase, iron-sulfur-dependent, subunit alpha [Thermanaerothrix sp.]
MRSFDAILERARNLSLTDAILSIEEEERGVPRAVVLERMLSRLRDMKASVVSVEQRPPRARLVGGEGESLEHLRRSGSPLSGDFVSLACSISMKVAVGNAAMRRIVACPTAGSCGIVPGVLAAYSRTHEVSEEELLKGLLVAGAVGSVIAERATLAGAEGGCQAECGAAAAMACAALVHLKGGDPEAVFHGAALVLQSIMGMVCDPVAGLVEVPCVVRNGTMVGVAALCADMALAGVRSTIPPDEVVDAMAAVGRALPSALRETSEGGLAATPTGQRIARQLMAEAPRLN